MTAVPDCPKCSKVVDADRRPYVCDCGLVLSTKNIWVHPKGHLGHNRVVHEGKRRKDITDEAGREAWRILHECTLGTSQWLSQWKQKIPKGCNCYKDFESMLSALPPRYESESDWFAWTVEIHNAVNRRLNKSEISIEQAERLWKSERLYSLHSTCEFGGIERWSISLASRLPCFGFLQAVPSVNKNKEIRSKLRSVAPDRTLEAIAKHGKPILVSNVPNFERPKGCASIAVAHGCCELTRRNVSSGRYDRLVAVSDLVADQVRKWTNRECVVIENGVDADRLMPTESRDALRDRYGLPGDSKVLGMVGRLNEEKGVYRMLDTLVELSDYHGLLVGWGNYQALQRAVNERGLTNRCRIVRSLEHVGDAYAAIDACVTLAEHEGFCLSAMEAMYCGLSLVSTDTGIVADLKKQHGDFGPAIVESNASPEQIADAVRNAWPVSIDLSKYTSDAMANRWEGFLRTL